MSDSKEITGILTKLEDEYAFAKTSKGSVFVGITAARTKNETLISLKDKFSYNEEVLLKIVPQSGKNSCQYQAVTMKKIDQNATTSKIPDTIYGPVNAEVTSSTDSFAFAQSDEFGTIFIPGDVFDAKIVKKVADYLYPRDRILVNFKQQVERSGCKWVAVSAVKHFETEIKDEKEADDGVVIISHGNVIDIGDLEITIFDHNYEIIVRCPILTYIGGKRGNKSAKVLSEIIKKEDLIMFKAIRVEDNLEAIQWKPIIMTEDEMDDKNEERSRNPVKAKVQTSDSVVQTPNCIVTVTCRALLRDHPEDHSRLKAVIDLLPDCALPTDILLDRYKKTFDNKLKW